MSLQNDLMQCGKYLHSLEVNRVKKNWGVDTPN